MALPTSLKFRSVIRFPAQVVGTSGVSVTIANGVYTFAQNIASLTAKSSILAAERDNLFVTLYDSDNSTFRKMTLDTWLTTITAGLDATLVAIAATAPTTDQGIYFSGTDVAATYPLTAIGRTISGLSSAPAKSLLTGGGGTPAFSTTPTVAGLTISANTASLPAPPTGTGSLLQVGNADGASTTALYDAFGTASFTAGVQFRKARGTAAASTAVQADDPIGGIYAFGYGATAYSTTQRGFAGFFAGENWTDANNGTYFTVYTTATGGSTSAEKLRVQADGTVNLPATGSLVVGHTAKLSVGGLSSATEVLGTTQATASLAVGLFDATASDQPQINFYRSKNAAIGSATVVASGDKLGGVTWYGAQQTGTFATQNPAAQIRAEVDGTVTSGAGADMPGRIVLSTTADGSGTLTDRLILDSAGAFKPNASGGVTLGTATLPFSNHFMGSATKIDWANGNVTLTHSTGNLALAGGAFDISGASAGQIIFPASQNASAGANTLDDYEEGTWTPAITYATPGTFNPTGGGGATSYVGSYTKIGRMVMLWCSANTGTMSLGTASGNLQVTGLPFAAVNTAGLNYYSGCSWSGVTKAGYTNIVARVATGTQLVDFPASGSGVAGGLVTATDTPTGGTVAVGFSIPYST